MVVVPFVVAVRRGADSRRPLRANVAVIPSKSTPNVNTSSSCTGRHSCPVRPPTCKIPKQSTDQPNSPSPSRSGVVASTPNPTRQCPCLLVCSECAACTRTSKRYLPFRVAEEARAPYHPGTKTPSFSKESVERNAVRPSACPPTLPTWDSMCRPVDGAAPFSERRGSEIKLTGRPLRLTRVSWVTEEMPETCKEGLKRCV